MFPSFCFAQANIAGKYIATDSAWLWKMKDSLSGGGTNNYNFGTPQKTVKGKWVVPAVNYIYFTFPDSATVVKLPSEDDSILQPAPIIVNTTGK